MKTIFSIALSVALSFSAAAALAEGTPMPANEEMGKMGERYMKTDTDSDGSISKAEWSAQGEKMFKEIDTSGDGKITKDEMKSHRKHKMQEWKERREDRKERHEEMKEKMEKMKDKSAASTPAEKH